MGDSVQCSCFAKAIFGNYEEKNKVQNCCSAVQDGVICLLVPDSRKGIPEAGATLYKN